MTQMTSGLFAGNVEELVAEYVRVRDEKTSVKEAAEAKIADLDATLEKISAELLDRCKEVGADSIRTGAGTVIRSIKSRFWTSDWESMYAFIHENAAYGLLEKRIHQSNMKNFLEENPDVHPMGLNIDKEFVVTVRRK